MTIYRETPRLTLSVRGCISSGLGAGGDPSGLAGGRETLVPRLLPHGWKVFFYFRILCRVLVFRWQSEKTTNGFHRKLLT